MEKFLRGKKFQNVKGSENNLIFDGGYCSEGRTFFIFYFEIQFQLRKEVLDVYSDDRYSQFRERREVWVRFWLFQVIGGLSEIFSQRIYVYYGGDVLFFFLCYISYIFFGFQSGQFWSVFSCGWVNVFVFILENIGGVFQFQEVLL